MCTSIMTEDGEKKPNLMDCEASELAAYLLQNRFQDDGMATASFLLECTSTLPNAEAISAQLMREDNDDDEEEATEKEEAVKAPVISMGTVLTEACTVSMTIPRGKFQMSLYEEGIRCINAKGDTLVITSAQRMVVFPKPEDCRKSNGGANMVLLCFDDANEVVLQGKPLKQVCLQLPAEEPSNTTWLEAMCSSLHLNRKDMIMARNPSGYSFQSHKEGNTSTTTGGMPFVQCYYGVKDGVLFPMEEGLLFFKPPMFLHRSALHTIACGRGSGGSRYVDMVLTLEEETTIEFTNIHRDELSVLNTYIHSILIPAMKKDANEEEETMDEVEVDDSSGKRKRAQRKASKEARQATRAEMDRHDESDSEDDEECWEEARHHKESDDESDDESNDEEDEVENSGGAMVQMEDETDDFSGKRKRTQRKASQEARQATRTELGHNEESDSEDDEEGWEEVQLDGESGDESDKEGEKETAGRAIVDDADEKEFFEEEEFFEDDSGTATESDDEGESSRKKARS